MFTNPLSHAGYPPGVTGTPTTQPSEVRAATAAEAAAGILTDVYISPATADSATALDFASPPVLGFGSTTPRPVHATTLDSTLNTLLATTAGATAVSIANVAPTGARTGIYHGGNSAQNDTVTWFGGNPSANAQSFTVFGGVPSGGTQTVGFFTGNASGGVQAFNLFTGTRAGTTNIATGIAAHTVNLANGVASSSVLNIGSASSTIGFFGTTAAAKTNSTTDIKDSLVTYGLITDLGATPLNLDGGTLTAGVVSTTGAIGAGTTLTATLGDITATNGNIVRGTAGNKDVYTSVASTTTAGANSAGTVTLTGGTATVSTTAVTASSIIRLYRQGIGATGAAALGILTIGTVSAGVSFVINAVQAADATALQASDVSSIGWEIVN